MAFGPRLNFIVGRNGTGKSSILAAIMVALGGNPNKNSGTAGGAKAGSGLVRDGSSIASVDLAIANGGPDPFYVDDDRAPPTLVVSLKLTRQESGRTTSQYSINGVSCPQKRVKELAEFYNYEVCGQCMHARAKQASGDTPRWHAVLALSASDACARAGREPVRD